MNNSNNGKYDFKIMKGKIEDRDTYIFLNDILNISYITTTKRCSLSFNLDLISLKEARKVVKNFRKYKYFDYEIQDDDPSEYEVLCLFPNTETDGTILRAIDEVFIKQPSSSQ